MPASKRVSVKREALDYSDIPDLGADDAFWAQAPVAWPPKKAPVSLRLDDEVLTFFKKGGRGYQTRINHVLCMYVRAQGARVASRNAEGPTRSGRVKVGKARR